jgi:hypothetical protein
MYAITREAFHCFRLASDRRALEQLLDEQWDDGDEPDWMDPRVRATRHALR